jgi:hypothetical protein
MIAAGLIAMAWPLGAQDPAAFKREYGAELARASHHAVELAKAMPAEKYVWRPADGAPSVSEVYMHNAAGNFLLLDSLGQAAPEDLYGKLELTGRARQEALTKRNVELEKAVMEKPRVVELLERSLDAVHAAFEKATPADLEKPVCSCSKLTVRAVYLDLLAHLNEYLGQSVAYARMNGIVPHWLLPAAKAQ